MSVKISPNCHSKIQFLNTVTDSTPRKNQTPNNISSLVRHHHQASSAEHPRDIIRHINTPRHMAACAWMYTSQKCTSSSLTAIRHNVKRILFGWHPNEERLAANSYFMSLYLLGTSLRFTFERVTYVSHAEQVFPGSWFQRKPRVYHVICLHLAKDHICVVCVFPYRAGRFMGVKSAHLFDDLWRAQHENAPRGSTCRMHSPQPRSQGLRIDEKFCLIVELV